MTALASRWASGVAQLVDWDEDDAGCCIEVRLKDLNHGDSLSVELQDTAFSAGRRVVCRLGQFDDVELFDFLGYGHRIFMLGGWICSDQPWGVTWECVVPGEFHRGASAAKDQLNLGFTGNPKRLAITHLSNARASRRLNDCLPDNFPILESDAKDRGPVCAVPLVTKNPIFKLAPLVPGVLSAREWFADLWWPDHLPDAMEQQRTCVRLRSFLRVEIHTEGARR